MSMRHALGDMTIISCTPPFLGISHNQIKRKSKRKAAKTQKRLAACNYGLIAYFLKRLTTASSITPIRRMLSRS